MNLTPLFQKTFPFLFKSEYKNLRPGLGNYEQFKKGKGLATYNLAYFLEQEVSIFSDIVLRLKQEILRAGCDWQPAFALKCNLCGITYQEKITACDCGSQEFSEPDKTQKDRFEKPRNFFTDANLNGQTLLEVLGDIEFNLDVADNAYLLCIKNYILSPEGDIIAAMPIEFLSVDPRNIRMIHNDAGDLGGKIWICLEHRQSQATKPDVCKICGRRMYEAFFETMGQKKQYYLASEVLHKTKYYPSILYGYPAILKSLDDAWAYHHLEKRVRRFYERGRAPGIATFPTNNQESLRAFWNETQIKLQEDPYYIPLVGYDAGQSKGAAAFMKLMEDPNPAMLEVKKELRERMGSRFGVSLIFMADTSTSGGLNNEGLQITVTNRAVEFGQSIFNEGFLPWVCKQFVITDFDLALNPSEEQDEMAEKERFAKDVQNAKTMLDMGFDVKFENDKFTFSGQAKKPEPQPFGFGGIPVQQQEAPKLTGEPMNLERMGKEDVDEFSEYKDLLSKAFIDSVLQAIKEGALYGFYEDVPDTDVTKIHEIIQVAFMRKRLSLSEMIDDIMKATGLDFDKSRLIARTEMHNVSQSARKIEWQNMEKERGETFKYLWSVKHDHRTSPQCLEIEELAGSGKSLVEMEKIIQQVAQKYIPKWKAEMTPHPFCRSTLIRVV